MVYSSKEFLGIDKGLSNTVNHERLQTGKKARRGTENFAFAVQLKTEWQKEIERRCLAVFFSKEVLLDANALLSDKY